MFLNQIWIHQFKNHRQLNLDFVEGVNAIYGANGVGKTNVLDAIYYLCNGKSYFTNMDSKIVTLGENMLSVRGIFAGEAEKTDELLITFETGKKKTIKRNKKTLPRILDHVGVFPAVMVTPTDIALIYDDSKARRRFLDLILCQTDKSYLQHLSNYNKYLEARNKLLKQMLERNMQDDTLLEAYTEKMIEPATYIYECRKAFIAIFMPYFKSAYLKIAGEEAAVEFTYDNDLKEASIASQFKNQIARDKMAGRTTKGIHKDDLIFTLDNEPLKRYASQGQIKSFLIAIKIAQFDYLKSKLNKKPLLLLDDIFEKIDGDRAQRLMEMVSDEHFGQIFISDTHEQRLENHIFGLNSSIKAIPLTHGK